MATLSLDRSRQWGVNLNEIAPDHISRYKFAIKYVKGRVLDAACGCGYGSKILLENASGVVGVDSSEMAIDWGKRHFQGPQFIKGRIEEEPWTGEFETVISLETLEHLQNPVPALKAFRRACTGLLITSVPNEDFYPFDPAVFANDESPHYRHYRPMEFQELLEDCGFEVLGRFCQKNKRDHEVIKGTEGRFILYLCA